MYKIKIITKNKNMKDYKEIQSFNYFKKRFQVEEIFWNKIRTCQKLRSTKYKDKDVRTIYFICLLNEKINKDNG